MNLLRRISTPRLIALIAAICAVALVGGIAIARAGGTAHPPRRPLAVAVHHALSGAPVQGFSARIKFTNHLFPAGALPEGTGSALLTGASGRLWISNDGRFRLELQSDAGDAQIMGDRTGVVVYDASSNTAYRIPISRSGDAGAGEQAHGAAPALAEIRKAIARISDMANLTGAMPTAIGGRPAYTVRVSPKHDGGLLGALGLGFDADHPVPLQVAVYARGDSSPVLALTATEVHYGAVSPSALRVAPAPGVKVVTVQSPSHSSGAEQHGTKGPEVSGTAAVAAKLGFPLAAPASLAGLPRQSVRLVNWQGTPSALVVYGKGLGAIVVLEQPASGDTSSPLSQLPSVSINGAKGNELATALGTVVRVDRGGVTTTVAGSVPPVAAEAAARELVGS